MKTRFHLPSLSLRLPQTSVSAWPGSARQSAPDWRRGSSFSPRFLEEGVLISSRRRYGRFSSLECPAQGTSGEGEMSEGQHFRGQTETGYSQWQKRACTHLHLVLPLAQRIQRLSFQASRPVTPLSPQSHVQPPVCSFLQKGETASPPSSTTRVQGQREPGESNGPGLFRP